MQSPTIIKGTEVQNTSQKKESLTFSLQKHGGVPAAGCPSSSVTWVGIDPEIVGNPNTMRLRHNTEQPLQEHCANCTRLRSL